MQAYITSSSLISPQSDLNKGVFPETPQLYPGNRLKSADAEYKEFIPAAMLRRMGRVLKLGIGAGMLCLKKSGIEIPDAIITGTGLGCVEDSENFLISIKENKENFLTPTPFIQSTHNTISGQIALLSKCHNHNFTFVHRAFSFESALLDSLMLIDEKPVNQNILVGGADELTDNLYTILSRLGFLKLEIENNLELLKTPSKGSLAGEGSAFFMLSSEKTKDCHAALKDVSMFYKPENEDETISNIVSFLEKNMRFLQDIDVVLTGINGDEKNDLLYHRIFKALDFKNLSYYKHLCGEYQTSTAFAMFIANLAIQNNFLPSYFNLNNLECKKLDKILIYNHFQNNNHALVLLERC